MIKLIGINKSFKNNTVLHDFSVEIKTGVITGVFGRSGAGKTTLLSIIAGLSHQTTGEITIFDEMVWENDKALSNIQFSGPNTTIKSEKIYKIFRISKRFNPDFDDLLALDLCKKYGVNPKTTVKRLSTGEVTLLKNILTLCSNREILIFDEPNLGLDAYSRDEFYKDLISVYDKNHCTVLISSHLIDELSTVIEDVIIIKKGRVILSKDVQNILDNTYSLEGNTDVIERYENNFNVLSSQMLGNRKTINIFCNNIEDFHIQNVVVKKPSLQEVFIDLTREDNNAK